MEVDIDSPVHEPVKKQFRMKSPMVASGPQTGGREITESYKAQVASI